MEPAPVRGVSELEGRVLVREDDFFVAMLRFETIVVCLEGEGPTSVGGEVARLGAGQQARRPKDVPPFWPEGTSTVTLMIERTG